MRYTYLLCLHPFLVHAFYFRSKKCWWLFCLIFSKQVQFLGCVENRQSLVIGTQHPPPPAPSESSLFNGANCSTVFITSAISGAFPKSWLFEGLPAWAFGFLVWHLIEQSARADLHGCVLQHLCAGAQAGGTCGIARLPGFGSSMSAWLSTQGVWIQAFSVMSSVHVARESGWNSSCPWTILLKQ